MAKSKLRDFDPESILDPAPSSSENEDSDFSEAEDVNTGREHYADVGKSKLRKKEVVPLGPQYSGNRVARDEMEDEDSDDPFAKGFDIDEDSEDDEKMKDTANMNGDIASKGSDEEEEGGSFDDKNMDDDSNEHAGFDDSDEDNVGDDDDEEEDGSEEDSEGDSVDQSAKLREMMKDTSALTSTISQAAKADVEKGEAIKTQRKTFDTLLNTRIRLQKALIASNSMASEAHAKSNASDEAVEAAEAAALALLNNLANLRTTLDSTSAGQKRKRPTPFTTSTASTEIWSSLRTPESISLPHRQAILTKWSTKTRGASALTATKSRLDIGNSTNPQQTLTDIVTTHLSDTPRLIKRTQTPRSCAPLQSAAGIQDSEHIYDDADFYGLLLKELLENRSSQMTAGGGTGAAEFIVQAPWQVAREAKTKKVVDTKASKGRKMRYTVHEKLQNFMAPEDRGTWVERQREDLFSSLFGQRLGLGEDVDQDGVVSDDEAADAEADGLMLFRS